MITLDQARQLKEAGFPQEPRISLPTIEGEFYGGYYVCIPESECGVCFLNQNELEEEIKNGKHYLVKIPQLEELIEACGEKFCGVHKLQLGGWIAFIFDIDDSTRQVETKGDTPEEAVMNLYIQLKLSPSTP